MFFRKEKNTTAYKHKRGFTLAETVLALAVISITSVASLSLILASQRATISAAQKQQAQLAALDIVSCFRVSDDYTDFENNVHFALGKEISQNKIELGNDTIANGELENNTITVVVDYGEKELAKLSFTKGA